MQRTLMLGRLSKLQQCLPLAVLKPNTISDIIESFLDVATVLTACGIETGNDEEGIEIIKELQQCLPLAVLKQLIIHVAFLIIERCNSAYRLWY